MRFIFVYTPFYTNADWILLMRRIKIMKRLDFYWSSNPDWWEWNESNKARFSKGGTRELQTLFRTDIRRTGKIIININIEVFL